MKLNVVFVFVFELPQYAIDWHVLRSILGQKNSFHSKVYITVFKDKGQLALTRTERDVEGQMYN